MKLVKNDTASSDFGWIGRGIEVKGDINFTERLQVDGKITGRVLSESGTLIIGEGGYVEAQVDVGTCVIHGSLHGDMIARARLEIHRTGRLTGDVITPALLVEEGAIFNGAIRMGEQAIRGSLEEVKLEELDRERKVRGA
ncbi:MAG TPA: polymer-forming cytoskeletal protein [Blastocatellia bacterium]|nr:polymer-forming cytoskeletal protein [Blastocatellia bacterium]